jgi:GNAT superfamily N-acetyltransferase
VTNVPAGIRSAVAGDLDGILRADHLAAPDDCERAQFLRHSVELGECQVYIGNGAVTGFVIVKRALFFGRDFIELLVVDPPLRRSGVGRALLRHALDTSGTAQLFTSTNTSNLPMRSLLQSEGWSFSGRLEGLDDGDPELVYYKSQSGGSPSVG